MGFPSFGESLGVSKTGIVVLMVLSLAGAINVAIIIFDEKKTEAIAKPEFHQKPQIDIAVLIIIATMGILFLVFFIILIILLYQKRILQNSQLIRQNYQTALRDLPLIVDEQKYLELIKKWTSVTNEIDYWTVWQEFQTLKEAHDNTPPLQI